jgi:hypothetical protein
MNHEGEVVHQTERGVVSEQVRLDSEQMRQISQQERLYNEQVSQTR